MCVSAVRDAVGDSSCLVALGGGADSAVLLWAAVEALGTDRVTAVFVFHDLEGSTLLRTSATELALSLNVNISVLNRPISSGGNIEARARNARYEAMDELLSGGVVGLTGHTADDQAETIMMRLFRGSGSGGLAGIPYRRGPWRRPLLEISRKSLRRTATNLDLPFADDPANEDVRYVRSRIRHTIVPLIESELGAESMDNVRRSGRLLKADDDLLRAAADLIHASPFPGGVALPTAQLVTVTLPVSSRAIRSALSPLLDGAPPTANDVDAVLRVAKGDAGVTISRGFSVVNEGPMVTIYAPDGQTVPDGQTLVVGEPFEWNNNRYTVTATDAAARYLSGGRFTVLDADAVVEGMSIRGPLPGDRIDTGEGSTPVKEVLRAAGVSARVRPHSLVVTVADIIAALVGVRVASWAAPRPGQSAIVVERELTQWT